MREVLGDCWGYHRAAEDLREAFGGSGHGSLPAAASWLFHEYDMADQDDVALNFAGLQKLQEVAD